MSSPPPPRGVHAPPMAADPASAYIELRARRRRTRQWQLGLAVLAVVVVGLAAATVAVSLSGKSHPSGRVPPSTSPRRGTSGPGSSTSTSTTRVPSGAGPALTSLSPPAGTAGQVVTISGANLYSPGTGQVVAYFGARPAPTACPTQSTCTATVPQGSPGAETVTVVTDAGTSNGLTFTYQ